MFISESTKSQIWMLWFPKKVIPFLIFSKILAFYEGNTDKAGLTKI